MAMPRPSTLTSAAIALLVGAIAWMPNPAGAAPAPYFEERTDLSITVNGTFVPVVGNFTSTEHDDIIWYAEGAATDYRWTPCVGCEAGPFTSARLEPQVSGRYEPIVGDFGGDDLDDVYWWSGTLGGADHLWINDGDGTFTSRPLDMANGPWTPIVLHDSDAGDGKDDILWRAAERTSPLWIFPDDGSGNGRTRARLAVPPGQALVGDWDGNGATDLLFYWGLTGCTCPELGPAVRPDALWRRWSSESARFSATTLNVKGQYGPVAGRFSAEGDRRSDILWLGLIAPGRGGAGDGPDVLWEGRPNGSFASSNLTITARERGLVVPRDRGDAFWVLSSDLVWNDTPAGPVVRPAGIRWFGGENLVIGRFTATDRASVLVYEAGTGAETLYEPTS
jgi:hypothetical protein